MECFEARELLSGLGSALTAALMARAAHATTPGRSHIAAHVATPGRSHARAVEPINNQVLNPVGTPTRRQALKTSFGAGFNGTYEVGPGRYSFEASQIFISGKGGSSAFLHGDVLVRIAVPNDPSVPPTGILTMFDKNRTSGSAIGLSLTADPASLDRFGRPTRFDYQIGDNPISSGTFAADQGQGTVRIYYGPPRGRGIQQGPAMVLVRGQLYTTGATNPLLVFQLNP